MMDERYLECGTALLPGLYGEILNAQVILLPVSSLGS
jgi:hypothetical protein